MLKRMSLEEARTGNELVSRNGAVSIELGQDVLRFFFGPREDESAPELSLAAAVEEHEVRIDLVRFFFRGLVDDFLGGEHFTQIPEELRAAAVEAEKSAHQIGFPQAVAVPVLNAWELSKETASGNLHEYPELAFFIQKE